MADSEGEFYSPPVRKVFTEFTEAIKFCCNPQNYYAFPAAVLILSTIDAIGSFLLTKPRQSKYKCFKACITRYFPDEYKDEQVIRQLWELFRNPLTHALTVAPGVSISCDSDNEDRKQHLKIVAGHFHVNLRELLEHLDRAQEGYLNDLSTDPDIQRKLSERVKNP